MNHKSALIHFTSTQKSVNANANRTKRVSIIITGVQSPVNASVLLNHVNKTIIGIFIHGNASVHLKTVQLVKFGTMMFVLHLHTKDLPRNLLLE